MKLGVDQFRGSEILFKPSIIGKDFAGITEILEQIFQSLDEKSKQQLCNFVFLTGGNTLF